MIINWTSWYFLLIAIIFGVLGTISLKLSDGLTRLKPSIYLTIFYSISFVGLTLALQYIDISIVYAVWSGVGTLLVAIIGVLLFKESVSIKKVISLFLIVFGVLGIHFANVFH
jgi:small multidrug resistance pump